MINIHCYSMLDYQLDIYAALIGWYTIYQFNMNKIGFIRADK